jgi:long-chain acyl-CoA synthetase
MLNVFEKILKFSKKNQKILLLENKVTYEEFYNLTQKYYKFLKINIKPRQVVCICSEYSVHYLAVLFACYLNKNAINVLDINSSNLEKKIQILNSKSSFLLIENKNTNLFKTYKKFRNFYFKKINNQFVFKKDEPRFLIYTSGTTNHPKGVMLSDKSISNNVFAINENLNFNKKDKFLIFSPPNYAMGISQILSAMYAKGEIFFYNKGLKFPNELLEIILKYEISILNLSISAFRILENYIKKKKFFSIRIVMSGGMQYCWNDFETLRKIFPKSKLINFYGCTENSPRISHCKIKRNLLYKNYFPVGKPIKGVKTKILKLNENSKNNNLGKILISGKSLMDGYFGQNNKNYFVNGWFLTGDLGFYRKGNLYLAGREDNIFSVGHEKICPEEIEALLKKKFNFNEVIISKTKDKILNFRPKYFIVPGKKSVSKNDILAYIHKNLSSYKFPKKIIFLKKIPRTRYGKIDRKALK